MRRAPCSCGPSNAPSTDRFDAWLRGYFDRNAYRPMTTAMFLQDIRDNLIKGDAALESQLQMNAWVYQPGCRPTPSRRCPTRSSRWTRPPSPSSRQGTGLAIPWADWNTQQRQRFLGWRPEGLRTGADWLTTAQLADLERTLNLANEGNAELTFAGCRSPWPIVISRRSSRPRSSLTSQGRRKFVLPLFQTLWNEGDWGRGNARRIYAEARPPVSPGHQRSVDQLVGRP